MFKGDRMYHLGLKKGNLSNFIMTVGSKARANVLKSCFDSDSPIFSHTSERNFITHTGTYKGKLMSIVAIGMGFSSMDFLVREASTILDGPIVIIRLGTCGAIDADGSVLMIPSDGSLIAQRCFQKNNAKFPFIISSPYHPDPQLTRILIEKTSLCNKKFMTGLNVCCDTFYASQGTIMPKFKDDNELLIKKYESLGVKTMEMETGYLFYISSICKCKIYTSAIQIIITNGSHAQITIDDKIKLEIEQIAGKIVFETLYEFGCTMKKDNKNECA